MKFLSILVFACLLTTADFGQVGIGTPTANSTLDVRGSLAVSFRSFTASTAASATDHTLVYTGTVPISVSLPDATTCPGRQYWIKNASPTLPAPNLIILPSGAQTIDGSASWIMDETNEIVRIVSNGTSWNVLNQDTPAPTTATAGGAWNEGGNGVPSAKAIGTISNYDLPFITNNIETMRLSDAGYLGLGTAAPTGRLQIVTQNSEPGDDYVFDDYGAAVSQGLYMTKSRGTLAAPLDLQSGDQIGWIQFIPHFNGTLAYAPGSAVEAYYKGAGSNNLTDLRFFTSGSEQMHLNETGSVGIGTQTFDGVNPEKLLVQAGVTTSFNVISGKGTIDNYLQLNIQNQSNTGNASSDVVATAANGNETINYVDLGMNSGTYTNTTNPILAGANNGYLYSTGKDFVIGNGSSGRNLIFFTGGYATTNEAMRISSAGNVGIGNSSPVDKLSVGGVVAPAADNAYTLGKSTARWSAVYATNGVIQTSDARLKTNIRPLGYGLKEIMQLTPVRFNWKDNPSADSKIGLIAQEVRKIIPEVVAGDEKKEYLGMNYAELIPVLVNAIKEQQQEILDIRHRIDALKLIRQARYN